MRILRPIVVFVVFAFSASTASAQQGDRFLDIREVTSPGGITAWLVEDKSVPVIAVEFAFKGAGSALESPGKQGLVRLLSNTMDEGAGDLDSQAFQSALSADSISLHFGASRDAFSGSLKTLKENRDKAFDLLELALEQPRFDEEPLERMKQANLARIRGSLADPEWLAARLFNDVAFEGHPYALNSGGTLTTLPAITADDLRQFANTQLSRDRLRVAVTGDITADELAPLLDDAFGDLPATAPPADIPDLRVQNAGGVVLFERDIPQTIIEIAQPGIGRDHPDYYAASVMNFILGSSGFGSRLMERVREKRGLTYGIYTGMVNFDHTDFVRLSTSTENANVPEVMNIIREEWERMRDEPVLPAEIETAKAYLVGSMPLMLSSTDRIAELVLSMQLDNLPIGYLDKRDLMIESVTIDDVRRVAKNLLVPEALTVVMVGRPQGMEPTRTVETLPNVE
ncbi:MAG: insulinase family protein [Alphaproteobacteria bacterium]|nr:insulinase family protein [Alphaproteobacteria bacterium]